MLKYVIKQLFKFFIIAIFLVAMAVSLFINFTMPNWFAFILAGVGIVALILSLREGRD